MAKIITTDFGAIHDALNRIIIGEVKAALRLVPGKRISWDGKTPLCRIILSPNEEYIPRDVEVLGVYIDKQSPDKNDTLRIEGRNADDNNDSIGILWWEDTDWLDITDFHYLIEQLKDLMPESENPHVLTNSFDRIALDTVLRNSLLCY